MMNENNTPNADNGNKVTGFSENIEAVDPVNTPVSNPYVKQTPTWKEKRMAGSKRPLSQKLAFAVAGLGLATGAVFGGMAVHETYFTDAPAQLAQQEVTKQLEGGYLGMFAGSGGIGSPSTYTGGSSGGAGVAPKANYTGKTDSGAGVSRTANTGVATNVPNPAQVKTAEAYGFVESNHWSKANLYEGDAKSAKATQTIVNQGGVVHYQGQAQPGEVGNFSVSGHRTSHGAIFKDAVNLKKGETVKVSTSTGVFEYKVIRENKSVSVNEAAKMLDSDPFSDYKNKSKAYMTIQTCVGSWSYDREIIVLELVK